jgi:hypothetical protein
MKNLKKRLENILKNFMAMKNENISKTIKNVGVMLMILPLLILLIDIISIYGIQILYLYLYSLYLFIYSILPTMINLSISQSQHQNILINIANMEISEISQGVNTSSYTYVLFTQQMVTIEHIILQDIIKDLTDEILLGIIAIISFLVYNKIHKHQNKRF